MSERKIDTETEPLWRLLIENGIVEEDVLRELYEIHLDTSKSVYSLLVTGDLVPED